jgi:acyl dehydratase
MIIEGYSLKNVPEFVGRELGVTDWLKINQELINQFAQCTDDHQWIHVDVKRAKRESPFGVPIAHGYLTLSLLAKFSYEVGLLPEGVKQTVNYGLDRVRFISPVRVGARIRDRVVLLAVKDTQPGHVLVKTQHTIEIEGELKPAMMAEILSLLIS